MDRQRARPGALLICIKVMREEMLRLRGGRMPKDERSMAEFAHFVAVPFDMSSDGLAAGEPASCPSPTAGIACAQGLWKVFGHAGAVALIRNAEPASGGTVLRRFGNVPDDLSGL
jgi:hypothetical protein